MWYERACRKVMCTLYFCTYVFVVYINSYAKQREGDTTYIINLIFLTCLINIYIILTWLIVLIYSTIYITHIYTQKS